MQQPFEPYEHCANSSAGENGHLLLHWSLHSCADFDANHEPSSVAKDIC